MALHWYTRISLLPFSVSIFAHLYSFLISFPVVRRAYIRRLISPRRYRSPRFSLFYFKYFFLLSYRIDSLLFVFHYCKACHGVLPSFSSLSVSQAGPANYFLFINRRFHFALCVPRKIFTGTYEYDDIDIYKSIFFHFLFLHFCAFMKLKYYLIIRDYIFISL